MPRNKREKSDLHRINVLYYGALDEHLQCNPSRGGSEPDHDPRSMDPVSRSPTCLRCAWTGSSYPARQRGFAFRFLVKPESPVLHKVIAVSCSMVVPMVIIMSMYGALEGCVKSGNFNLLLIIWLTNIPKNFIMALPFQLLVAGPLVRRVFRGAFPEGTVLA